MFWLSYEGFSILLSNAFLLKSAISPAITAVPIFNVEQQAVIVDCSTS